MDNATSGRRRCWEAALACLLQRGTLGSEAGSTRFASGEVFHDEHAAKFALVAVTTGAPLLFSLWNQAWPAFPTQIVAFPPKKKRVAVVEGLVPWMAADQLQVILVEPGGARAYVMSLKGRLRRCARPRGDLESGVTTASARIGLIASEIEQMISGCIDGTSMSGDCPF